MKRWPAAALNGKTVGLMAAGELAAYALLGMGGVEELPRLALSLAAGAVAGTFFSCRAPKPDDKADNRCPSPRRDGVRAERLPPGGEHSPLAECSREQARLRFAAGLAAQLEENMRRFWMDEQNKKRGWNNILQSAGEQAKAVTRAVQLTGEAAGRVWEAGRRLAKGYDNEVQGLLQAAFQANLLALHLQQAEDGPEKQAAAQGLRLLAARCCRCEKRLRELTKKLPGPEAGELKARLQEAEGLAQRAAKALREREAALQEKTAFLPPQPFAPLAKQAHALLELLKGEEKEGTQKEGVVEGTALYYRLE